MNQDSALPGGTVADVDTEIVNPKQLYQTFMRLVEGDTINFITQGNRQQHHNAPAFNKGPAAALNDDDFN